MCSLFVMAMEEDDEGGEEEAVKVLFVCDRSVSAPW